MVGGVSVVVLVVLAVTVGALGGWARTTPDEVRVMEPGAEVRVTPLRVRLDRAEATYELFGSPAEEGRAYVVVHGTLALDHDESVELAVVTDSLAADLPLTYTLFDAPSDKGELSSVHVADDGSLLQGLGPGLTYRVLFVFEVDDSAMPDEMTVVLNEHVRRPSFFDGTIGWFDPQPSAEVSLVVSPLPDERPSEDVP